MNHLKPLAIVAGALAAKPGNGGHAWARVSFVVGLQRLGFDVVYVEQQPGAGALEHSYFTSICSQFHIEGFLLSDGESTALARRVAGAALLVNIGGHLTDGDIKGAARRRVYVDDDPGYTQLWNQAGLLDGRLDGHDLYLTFGGNIGHEDCSLPTGGFDWRPMLPPVVLDDWPVAATSFDRFTTVATWRGGYGRVPDESHFRSDTAGLFDDARARARAGSGRRPFRQCLPCGARRRVTGLRCQGE